MHNFCLRDFMVLLINFLYDKILNHYFNGLNTLAFMAVNVKEKSFFLVLLILPILSYMTVITFYKMRIKVR